MKRLFSFVCFALVFLTHAAFAQVNSGSDGSDGALNATSNTVIDMHDHPDGIYQYTSVDIPAGASVSFIHNDANSPVIWLVQGDCTISGVVYLQGFLNSGRIGGTGGPGGFAGGNGAAPGGAYLGGAGLGPGGGPGGDATINGGGFASYGSSGSAGGSYQPSVPVYGSPYLLPLVGGSGGGGSAGGIGGSGGGGAILIAVSGTLTVATTVYAGGAGGCCSTSGYGSGGAIRLVASTITGTGSLYAQGIGDGLGSGGSGRIRVEAITNNFTGVLQGVSSIGYPNIILLPSNQEPRLKIESVAGVAVDPNPQTAPNVRVPGLQSNPINIVVLCENVAMNSQITVDVKPLNGSVVSATGTNNTGMLASSTAVVSLNMPRGEGTIQARTTTPIGLASADMGRRKGRKPSLYETGLAANGERFAKAEITSTLGGGQQVVYITESGKKFPLGAEIKKAASAKPVAKKG